VKLLYVTKTRRFRIFLPDVPLYDTFDLTMQVDVDLVVEFVERMGKSSLLEVAVFAYGCAESHAVLLDTS